MKYLLVESFFDDFYSFNSGTSSNRLFSIVKRTGTTFKIVDSKIYFKGKYYLPEDFKIIGETNYKNLLQCLRSGYPELLI